MKKNTFNYFITFPPPVRRPSVLSDDFFVYGLYSLFVWFFALLLVMVL